MKTPEEKAERARRNAKRYYERMKNNPEFKRKAALRLKKWIKKNREHFNDLCRERNRIYQKKMQYMRREQGLCPKCGGKRDKEMRWKHCTSCRKKLKKHYYEVRYGKDKI